jgi:hypothetical protein
VGADVAALFHDVDEAGGAGIAELELALEHGGGGVLCGEDEVERLLEHVIVDLVFLPALENDGAGALDGAL